MKQKKNTRSEVKGKALPLQAKKKHKNIVMWAVNLYNEFACAQENFDAGG